MVNPIEEKALVGGYHKQCCMDSLEGQISSFHVHDSDESQPSVDGDWDDDFDVVAGSREFMRRTLYWESQEALLREILERYCITGSKLRQDINQLINKARERDFCSCPKPSSDGCLNCLRRRVVGLLCDKGFDASIRTSKWKHTHNIPGGSHEYIEVITSAPGRKKQMTYLIELQFQEEFKMAKACNQYQKLTSQLPQFYIGKPEHLNAILHVICDAAKNSMKEKNIHMGPWRKQSFMQMKWSGSHQKQSVSANPSCPS